MRLLRSSAPARWARLWRRELDPRGAQRLSTDAGPLAGLIECAFNRLCVCGRGSSAPTRVCLDAQICLLGWVSFTAVGALHTSSIATAQGLKDYHYAVDADCHRRHRAPAAAAAGPVPPCLRTSAEVGHGSARAGVTHPREVLAPR